MLSNAASRSALIHPSLGISSVRLSVPLVQSIMHVGSARKEKDEAIQSPSAGERGVAVEVHNAIVTETGTEEGYARVICSRRGQHLWNDYLLTLITIIVASDDFVVAALEDGGMQVWSICGRRVLANIVLDGAVSFMDIVASRLLVVTCIGQLYVW